MPVAAITSASSRGGTRITMGLVDDGWDIVLWDPLLLAARADEVRTKGRRAIAGRGDIGRPRDVTALGGEAQRTFGGIDAAVHLCAEALAPRPDGSDPATTLLVELGALLVVYVAQPGWPSVRPCAWCTRNGVEAVVVDATAKVHNLAPLVRSALGGLFGAPGS